MDSPIFLSSSSRSRSTTGRSEYFGFGLPLGRPRCEARMTLAWWRNAYSIVGSVATMRVSSVISLPSSESGTLKSTRMNTRLFLSSMSRMDSLAMMSSLKAVDSEQWSVFSYQYSAVSWRFRMTASISISTRQLGLSRAATTTMVAAGRMSPKNSPWTRPTASQSST